MSTHRSHFLAATCIAALLVACSGKEPEPAPQTETAKAEPASPAPATPAAPAEGQTPAETPPAAAPSSTQPASGKSTPPRTPPTPAAAPSEPAPPKVAPTESQAPAPSTPPATAPSPQPPQAPPAQPQATPAPSTAPASGVPPKDVVILKASLGGVRFEHRQHSQTRKIACETCHHPSRAEEPAAAPQQACGLCHTLAAAAPMKTKLQAAFHNPTATAGTCIDCHKAQNAAGKAAPVKCLDCHKRENK